LLELIIEEKMTQYQKLKEQHAKLSREVEVLISKGNLSPIEQQQLVLLKKLKLAYKDALRLNK
jgi:uncharacterized protein YdcH (DUF465 family)